VYFWAPADGEEDLPVAVEWLWAMEVVVVGLVAAASPVELWRAAAREQAYIATTATTVRNRALGISVQTVNAKPSR
jgi:hypothetical protein